MKKVIFLIIFCTVTLHAVFGAENKKDESYEYGKAYRQVFQDQVDSDAHSGAGFLPGDRAEKIYKNYIDSKNDAPSVQDSKSNYQSSQTVN